MRNSIGTRIAAGYAIAMVLLAIIGVTSYTSTRKLLDTSDLRQHTDQVLSNLELMVSDLKDAETGQRGFVITAKDEYLEPYNGAQAKAAERLANLRQLTRDDPRQISRLDEIKALVDTKFAELAQTIETRRKGGDDSFKATQAIVLSGRGKQAMDSIRAKVVDIETDENELLQQRTLEAASLADDAKAVIVFGVPLALAVLVAASWFIVRTIAPPLVQMTGVAEQMASGNLAVTLPNVARDDEIGALGRSFARMIDSLQGMSGVASRIAAGDLAVSVKPQSEKDLLGWSFSRMIDSLQGMSGVASRIASGDLRVTIKPQSDKDVLGNAFAAMIENLQRLTSDLSEAVGVLGAAARQIAASSSQMASSATETATAIAETTTTAEEVRQTAQVANQKAKYVADAAQKAATTAEEGKKSTELTSDGMSKIREQMATVGQSMVRLSEQTQTIGQIISSVDDLSQQSNLLAVNAAIEAAKAGEQGRGFAVVAQEVRNLAEQSKQATAQVRAILGEVQKATTGAVLATEQGSKAVDKGVTQSAESGKSIMQLAENVSEAALAAQQIAASSQQQLVGIDQVATAIDTIKQASDQNVQSARQLEGSAQNLNDLGEKLRVLIGKYKLNSARAA